MGLVIHAGEGVGLAMGYWMGGACNSCRRRGGAASLQTCLWLYVHGVMSAILPVSTSLFQKNNQPNTQTENCINAGMLINLLEA